MRRLGLIGGGGHGRYHLEDALKCGFELTALYEPAAESLAKVRRVACDNFMLYPTARELLASNTIDAVIITSPDEYHAEQLTLAVEYGVPTLVDKPLATNLLSVGEVKVALAKAWAAGLVVTSCHPRRFDPPYQWARANLPRLTQRLGQLIRIDLSFWYHIPNADWKREKRSLLLDHFPHEIDYLRVLLGPACPVMAWPVKNSPDHYCVMGHSGDVAFSFTGSRKLERDAFPEEIRFTFARGTCTVNTENGQVATSDYEREAFEVSYIPPTNHNSRNLGVMHDFVGMLDGMPGELTHSDLIANTESAIVLATGRPYGNANR